MRHPDGRTTVVPDHGSQDLHPKMTHKVLKDGNIDISDFLAAL